MLNEVRPAIVILTVLTLITGLGYPLAITGLAGLMFPRQAQGSLIETDGKPIGSALIGQAFTRERYFHGRPSAATTSNPNDPTKTVPAPYNAANSGGSNLGPTNKALIERVQGDLDGLKGGTSVRNRSDRPRHHIGQRSRSRHLARGALFQVPRVAKARGVPGGRAASAREPTCGRSAARVLRRATRQRARPEPGPGRHGALTQGSSNG